MQNPEQGLRNFRDLKVWQKSHELTLAIYRASQQFPKAELYGLTTQLRRAAVSIEANIAEVAVGAPIESCSDFYESRWDRQLKPSAIC